MKFCSYCSSVKNLKIMGDKVICAACGNTDIEETHKRFY